ncbi:MAG: tetratricopeptide repeat protein, partial [Terriglobales bacterium]
PDLAAAQFGLGQLELRQRQYPAAIAALRRAVALKPASASALNLLGQAYLRFGQRQKARAAFAAAARLRRASAQKLQREISGPPHSPH